MTDTKLLQKAMRAYGGTQERFAVEVLGRTRSTLTKWLSGDRRIPEAVKSRLKSYLTEEAK